MGEFAIKSCELRVERIDCVNFGISQKNIRGKDIVTVSEKNKWSSRVSYLLRRVCI